MILSVAVFYTSPHSFSLKSQLIQHYQEEKIIVQLSRRRDKFPIFAVPRKTTNCLGAKTNQTNKTNKTNNMNTFHFCLLSDQQNQQKSTFLKNVASVLRNNTNTFNFFLASRNQQNQQISFLT